MNFKERLKGIAEILLDDQIGYNEQRLACLDLDQLFKQASGFDDDTFKNTPHLNTGAGLAISPFAAAFCIIDFVRTSKFLQGIKAAIDDKLMQNTGRPVIIIYAGSGPFATLLTPLTTFFSSKQIQFVLIEFHPETEKYLANTIKAFELQPYILETVFGDASQYFIPPKNNPDIIISETMKPALEKEPQVSIMANLLAQSGKETVIVPEEIKIEAALTGNSANPSNKTVPLKTVMNFNRQYIEALNQTAIHPETLLQIPVINDLTLTQLVLCTTIYVYGKHFISRGESGLTINTPVFEVSTFNKKPVEFNLVYKTGENPGLVFSKLD